MACFANMLVTRKIEKCLMSDMIIKWDLLIFLYTLTISHVSPGKKNTIHHVESEFLLLTKYLIFFFFFNYFFNFILFLNFT